MTLTVKESNDGPHDRLTVQAAGGWLYLAASYSPGTGVYIHHGGSFPLDAKSARALAAKLNEWAEQMDKEPARE